MHVDRPTWGYFKICPEIAEEFKRSVKLEAKRLQEVDRTVKRHNVKNKSYRSPKWTTTDIEQFAAETMVVALAKKFDGTFIGT